jgi:hypothetical protein
MVFKVPDIESIAWSCSRIIIYLLVGKETLSSWRIRKFDYTRTVPAVLVVPTPLGDRPHIGLRMVNRGQRVE